MILSNPIDLQRINEGVVVSLAKLPAWASKKSLSLHDQSGQVIPCQLDDLNGDGQADELYFQVSMAPRETLSLQVEQEQKSLQPAGPFKVIIDHDLVSIEMPGRVLVSKGPEEIQVFIPSRKAAVLVAGYAIPSVASQESRNRIISEGPLRVVVEQKALWRSASEAYIMNHRIIMALGDPLIRSGIDKVRWPQGAAVPSLSFELDAGEYTLKPFSTRWLLNGGTKSSSWNGAVLFKAAALLQPKPVSASKKGWRQMFNSEAPSFSQAWMAEESSGQSSPEWDRQVERAQQRWLNPIEVFVAD